MAEPGDWRVANGLCAAQNGLTLGVPYSAANYPAALNPATDGLRNLIGRVNTVRRGHYLGGYFNL
jgi:hypothetical protein